jgi:hypothetical protein
MELRKYFHFKMDWILNDILPKLMLKVNKMKKKLWGY